MMLTFLPWLPKGKYFQLGLCYKHQLLAVRLKAASNALFNSHLSKAKVLDKQPSTNHILLSPKPT